MQRMPNIVEWNKIKAHYRNSIILGNGASIAVSKHFKYDSLYKEAIKLNLVDNTLEQIFSYFKTNDFENVLYKLLQAKAVNEALTIDNHRITSIYENCRDSLIKVIQNIHPKYDAIDPNQFINISNFLKNFETVISLNYDLILYWAMLHGNKPIDEGYQIRSGSRFKDCFTESANGDKCFNFDWGFLRGAYGQRYGTTLIFYLHGNLSLANYSNEAFEEFEVKITSPGAEHIKTIFERWNTNHYSPLFVCEGETRRKLVSIKGSVYLNTIYNDVFNDLGDTIAIYGWDMKDQDDHVLERLGSIQKTNKKPFKRIAISVYRNGQENNFMTKAMNKINKKISKDLPIDFYDSASSNCWNNSQ